MSIAIEWHIQKLLLQGESPSTIADEISDWVRASQTLTEKRLGLQFLMNAGMTSKFFTLLSELCAEEAPLPWNYIIEELSQLGLVEITDFDRSTLIRIAQLETVEHQFALSPSISLWGKNYRDLYEAHKALFAKREQKRKEELLRRLQVAQNQRLPKEEEKLLYELEARYPRDETVLEHLSRMEERRAQVTLDKYSNNQNDHDTLSSDNVRTSQESESMVFLFDQALQKVRKNPHVAPDLTTFFEFLDAPDLALELLAFAEEGPSKDWRQLVLLLQDHKYIQALGWCETLESRYASTPDAAFSVALSKARSYWALDQKETAIDILETVVSYRPHFRNARSLLHKWKGQKQ